MTTLSYRSTEGAKFYDFGFDCEALLATDCFAALAMTEFFFAATTNNFF